MNGDEIYKIQDGLIDVDTKKNSWWSKEEEELHMKYGVALANREKIDRTWFYDNMRQLVLKNKSPWWEFWNRDKVKESGHGSMQMVKWI